VSRALSATETAQTSLTYLPDHSGRVESVTRVLDASGDIARTWYRDYGDFTTPRSVEQEGVRLSLAAQPQVLSTACSLDEFGAVLSQTDATGTLVVQRDLDGWGRIQSETNAAGATTNYVYDRLGRAVEASMSAGGAWMDWSARQHHHATAPVSCFQHSDVGLFTP